MEQRFKIGTRYTTKRKGVSREKTILDVFKTYNSKGDLVQLRYVCSHSFMGQPVIEYDVTDVEIARALFEEGRTIGAL